MSGTNGGSPDRQVVPEKQARRPLWARIATWAGAGLALLLVLVAVTILILAHSARFHNYLLMVADEKAGNAIGVPVQLQNFAIHLSNLSLDLYGVRISGADPYPKPPLLQVNHIGLSIRVTSILHMKWYLESVHVDRPVVQIFTDKQDVSNLPKSQSSSNSKANLFDLGIRHAVLDRGEVYFNNRKSALDADLHDLSFHSSFDPPREKYSGSLSYDDGHLRLGSLNPVPHALEAQFEATPSTFHLTEAKLTSGRSQLLLTAALRDYSEPKVQAHYEATVYGSEVSRILNQPSMSSGAIHASGSVQYQSSPTLPFIATVVLDGDLSSPQLDVRTSRIRARIDNIAAHYSLVNGDAMVRDFRAHLLGGEISGTLHMHDIAGNSRSSLNASLHGISLGDLQRIAPASSATRDIALRGTFNADANATWGKTLDNLVARANVTLHGSISRAAAGRVSGATVVPVSGSFTGAYRGATKELAVTRSYLKTPQTSLNVNGAVSNRATLAIQFDSRNLNELETIAELFQTPAPGHPMQPLGLAGSASFNGKVHGSTADPRLTGELTASQFQVKGTAWKTLRANIDLSPSSARLSNGDLQPASHGRVSFNASTGLTHWSFTKTSPVQLELHASQMNIADLAKVAGSQIPVAGTLAANITLHGTELNPVGQGDLSVVRAKVYSEPVEQVKLTFAGTGDEIHGNLGINLPAGNLESVVALRPKQQSYTAQVTANGIHLGQLQTLKDRNLEVSGALTLKANGQGTFQDPQISASLQVPQLEIQKQAITGLDMRLDVARHVASASFDARALNNPVRAQAKVNLSGDEFAQASLDTQSIPLQTILAAYAPSQAGQLSGATELHATLHGPLKDTKLLAVHIIVPTLKVDYSKIIQLAAVSPIHADFINGVFTLQHTEIRGTDIDLQLQGSYPIGGKAPPSILLVGSVNLKIAQLFSPDVRSSGEMQFNINSFGTAANPNAGQVRIVDANFADGNLPIGLQHGNAVLTLTKDRLNINSFEAVVGGGKVTASGGVAYRPKLQFDLGATANGVSMLYPQGLRETLGADLRLTGTEENALLGGRVRIGDLSFTPSFDLTGFIGQLSSGVSPPPAAGFSQNVNLNLAVSSTNNVNLVSRTLSIDGTANLQVRGTAAQPVILGRINLSGGDLIFNGNRFVLNGGTVEFVNPAQTQPSVNVALTTTIQQYNIHLRFNGPVDQMRTSYNSDPSLPSADIINLLAFGQTSEASAANPTPGNEAAMGLVASQVSSQVTSRVSKIAGISQLSINPVLSGGSSQGPAGANITIQQRVTGNLFITFSTNVATTQNQTIMGQYRLSPRVSVSGTRDQNGGFAFDTTLQKTW